MADRHDADGEKYSSLITRRGVLKTVGAGVLGGLASASAAGPARAAPTKVDLGEEGLADGDDIAPYIDQHFQSGNEVHVPAGSYDFSNVDGLTGEIRDAALIGSEEGVKLHRPSDPEDQIRPHVQATGGTVRIENFTIKGKKGQAQSRWRFDAVDPDSTVEVVNVNHPDGSVDCSDSFAFYVGKDHRGTVRFKNCYVANMGNSSFYINQSYSSGRNNPVIMDNCVVINANGTSRHGTNGSIVRDCTFVWRKPPKSWKDCNAIARGPRWDEGGKDMIVENCHFHFESDVGSSEGAMKVEDYPVDGVVRDVFVHNETGETMFVDAGGLDGFDFENIHITGSGKTASGPLASVKHQRGPDLRNEDVVWMPESRTVRPGGASRNDGSRSEGGSNSGDGSGSDDGTSTNTTDGTGSNATGTRTSRSLETTGSWTNRRA